MYLYIYVIINIIYLFIYLFIIQSHTLLRSVWIHVSVNPLFRRWVKYISKLNNSSQVASSQYFVNGCVWFISELCRVRTERVSFRRVLSTNYRCFFIQARISWNFHLQFGKDWFLFCLRLDLKCRMVKHCRTRTCCKRTVWPCSTRNV